VNEEAMAHWGAVVPKTNKVSKHRAPYIHFRVLACPENVDNTLFSNTDMCLEKYMATHPRRQLSSFLGKDCITRLYSFIQARPYMVATATALSAKYSRVMNIRMQTVELTPREKNPSLEAKSLSVKKTASTI
jgi:hypothetical protein